MTTRPPEFIQLHHASDQQLRAELSAGLLAAQAHASPKYFYDALGSRLFAAICELPEYYLSRTEASIFDAHLGEIAAAVGTGGTLIDLGAGNCAKAARLFPALQPAQYVPVDISVDFLRDAVGDLQQRFPHIRMTGLGLDFSSELQLPESVQRNRRTFFYPGSSIGNFTPAEAAAFFGRLRAACGDDGGLLAGVDLVKATEILDAAYNDALGVTAAFNLNLLARVNREFAADFDPASFAHVARYDEARGRVEMHLQSRKAQTVHLEGQALRFAAGETIHTENSYKYTPDGFAALARQAGWQEAARWSDEARRFGVMYLRAV